MVKVNRTGIPPASLAKESKKAKGSYSKSDVVMQLKADFHDKCYICELKGLSDSEVEHLKPHYKRTRKELVFQWENLFYACRHCNIVKANPKYGDWILDCCRVDPEEKLQQRYADGHVRVCSLTEEKNAKMTAVLIEECFEKMNTGIREAACQYRINELEKTMGIFYKTLEQYQSNRYSNRCKKSLFGMLERSSKFAAFKRQYIRDHSEQYPELMDCLANE